MSGNGHSSPAELRARLSHPIIDADGHWLEYGPVFSDQIRKVGGDKAAEGFLATARATREAQTTSVAERRRRSGRYGCR